MAAWSDGCRNRSPGQIGTISKGAVSLPHDFEFLRLLLLYLEDRQTSPRATVIVDTRDEAAALDCHPAAFEQGLTLLLDLGYVEGPGADGSGLWLFRKLSRKGVEFVRLAREPKDWLRLKHRYGEGTTAG